MTLWKQLTNLTFSCKEGTICQPADRVLSPSATQCQLVVANGHNSGCHGNHPSSRPLALHNAEPNIPQSKQQLQIQKGGYPSTDIRWCTNHSYYHAYWADYHCKNCSKRLLITVHNRTAGHMLLLETQFRVKNPFSHTQLGLHAFQGFSQQYSSKSSCIPVLLRQHISYYSYVGLNMQLGWYVRTWALIW